MSASIANFASCLGKYDATLSGSAVLDISGMIGNSDLSMNAGYLTNTTGFVMPSAIDGNGISFSGWFNPNGAEASNYTPIFDISCSATQSITLCVSGNSLTPALVGNYNGNQVYQATGITANTWNFFTYTICCSGASQQLVQNLYVNNNTVSVTGGTYTALTFANSNVGYGTGIFANYFNGKIDDFRYYGRCLRPMEVRVLNSYAYGKSTVSTLVPSLGTITYTAGLPTSVPFVFTNTGTYSYLQYKRIGNNGTAYMGTLSPSAMVPSGQTYTWTDTTVVPAVTYLYTWTPYILGTPGLSSSVQSIYTLAPASAFTGFTPSAFTPTGFTLTWTGGVGTSINYLYYINNTPITANYTGSGASQTLTFTGLTAPTSGTTPTAYAWYVDICANNLAGTTHGTTTVYAPPTALVLSSAYSSGNVTLSWTGGAGNAVSYYYYIMSGTGTQSTGQTITSPYNVPVTGQGPWTIDVSATNTTGTVGALTTAQANPFTISTLTTSKTGYTTDQLSSLSGSLSTGNGIVGGTSTTNGITYQCYAFGQTSTWGTYTLTYTGGGGSYMYVLAVGGGGGSGTYFSGGGGGGGVVMMPVYFSGASSGSIAISIGNGGLYGAATASAQASAGSPTTVTFSVTSGTVPSPSTIKAGGGGPGTPYNVAQLQGTGGSLGGMGYSESNTPMVRLFNVYNTTYTYSNIGGYAQPGSNKSVGGGGGAGTVGCDNANAGGNGGNGIQCFLPGIKDFTPSGYSTFGTYYWGGGGGGGRGNSYSPGNGGNGGGGGGGGGTSNISTGDGGAGINVGGCGVISTVGGAGTISSGAGGANTGGGAGGADGMNSSTSLGSSGGSGIVVLAFPQTTVASNMSAVLPSTLVTSSAYNAVLNNTNLSAGAYGSIKGAFACKLLNYDYFGPVMTLRYNTDTNGIYTTNFYADVCGNLGTGYLGTGQSVSSWLTTNGATTTYAFVTKWYNQGMDISFNSVYQYATGYQPIYDVANGVINFGYTGGTGVSAIYPGYFNLPINAFPANDSSFTCTTRYYNYGTLNSDSQQNLIDVGSTPSDCALKFNTNTNMGSRFPNRSYDAGSLSTNPTNATITYKYNSYTTAGAGSTMTIWQNGSQSGITKTVTSNATNTFTQNNPSIGNNPSSTYPNTGGFTANNYYLQAQLYNLFYFNTFLTSGGDQNLIEATPYTYATPGAIAGLTATNITLTGFTLNWTSFNSTATYALWINGSYFMPVAAGTGTLTTGPVTPTSSAPWNLSLYAYSPSPSYALLATGTYTPSIDFLPFNTINSFSVSTVSLTMPTPTSPQPTVAVNLFQTKMIVVSGGGIGYYSTSSDGGGTWAPLIAINGPGDGGNSRTNCGLSSDGTKGYIITSVSAYCVIWTGTVPTMTAIPGSGSIGSLTSFLSSTMSTDGLTLIFCAYNGSNATVYYTRFNGTTYNTWASTGITTSRMAVAITPDSSKLWVSNGNPGDYNYSITWNGNVGTFSGATSLTNHPDDRGGCLIGGNKTTTPKYLFGGSANVGYMTWTPTTLSTSTFTNADTQTTDNGSFTMSGLYGNICYYAYNSTTIKKVTLNVT